MAKTLCKHCKAINPAESPACHNCGERNAQAPSDATACSPSSLTRETDQLEECDQYKVDEDYAEYNAYRRMVEHARTLERERDEWRKKAVDLHARHKGALEDIEAEIAERNEAREIAAKACAMLAENGFETNYPPMPWDSDSPENSKL
jgi:hypothetical protein